MGNNTWGLIASVLGSLCTGSGFVPVKRYPPGDGFFNQLVICTGAFCVAFVVNCIQGFPDVFPLAMIGGVIWAISNAFGIVVINVLGLGVSVLLWNASAMVIGWSQSKFGWPNLPKEHIEGTAMNFIGLAVLLCGATCYVFVRSDVQEEEEDEIAIGDVPSTISDSPIPPKFGDDVYGEYAKEPTIELASETQSGGPSLLARALGVLGAMAIGVGYGTMITPITYMQSHKEDFARHNKTLLPSDNSLDFVLSFFIGTELTSVIIFAIYCAIKKNRPYVDSQAILSSVLSGLIFGCSQTFFILANQELSQSVAYPIGTMLPGLVASLWSLLYFREIKGRRNMIILAVAYTLTLSGVVIVTISKESGF